MRHNNEPHPESVVNFVFAICFIGVLAFCFPAVRRQFPITRHNLGRPAPVAVPACDATKGLEEAWEKLAPQYCRQYAMSRNGTVFPEGCRGRVRIADVQSCGGGLR